MFVVNEDNSIYVTRGDAGTISVTAKVDGANYVFKAGDVVRFKVTQKKNCENVVLQKDFAITVDTEIVDIYLSEKDTKIGDVISKPVDYWYEVELNPFTNPQTIIGYDDDGAKIFKLHPEGRDLVDEPTTEEDVPVVDTDLSLTSSKPVENKVIARAVTNLNSNIATLESKLAEEKKTRETQQANLSKNATAIASNVTVLETRMNTFTALEDGTTTADAEIIDARIDDNGYVHENIGNSIRSIGKRFGRTSNLLDNSKSVGGFLNNGGGIATHDNYLTSDFIPVVNGVTYYCGWNGSPQSMRFVVFYSSEKVYITNLGFVTEFTIDNEHIKYIRFTYWKTMADKIHLNANSLKAYEPYFSNGVEGFNLLKEEVNNTKEVFFESPNLIDTNEVTKGYFDNRGSLQSNDAYIVSDFIPVEYGKTYYFSLNGVSVNMRLVSGYSIDKGFIGYLPNDDFNEAVNHFAVVNTEIKYVRITYANGWDNVQLEENQVTDYCPKGLFIKSSQIIGENPIASKWQNKKVAWVGSSITQGYKWCEVVNSYFNFNATNCGVGGTAMCYEGISSMCTKERLLGQYSNAKDENTGEITYNGVAIPEDVDIIFIECGTNDWARNWALGDKKLAFDENGINVDTSTFYGACHQFFKNATELFPNATIIAVGTPFGKLANRELFTNKYGLLNNKYLQSIEYGDALVDVAGMWGCYGVNMGREMNIHDNNISTIIPDGLHLTTTESQIRAGNVVINYLLSKEL